VAVLGCERHAAVGAVVEGAEHGEISRRRVARQRDAGAAQTATVLRSALLAHAGRPPIFAAILAAASRQGGIEIKEADAGRTRPIFTDTDVTRKTPATELAGAFNKTHPDYRAEVTHGLLVIRPVSDRASRLAEPSPVTSPTTITGRMAAARRLFGISGAVLGSTFSLEGEDMPLVLDHSLGPNLVDALNRIVMQVAERLAGDDPQGGRPMAHRQRGLHPKRRHDVAAGPAGPVDAPLRDPHPLLKRRGELCSRTFWAFVREFSSFQAALDS
jgi:hypothetical protein